jgi:hypothetical protein
VVTVTFAGEFLPDDQVFVSIQDSRAGAVFPNENGSDREALRSSSTPTSESGLAGVPR